MQRLTLADIATRLASKITGICCGDYAGQLVEGQSFLCMSLAPETVNIVAEQLLVPSLFIYDWHLPVSSVDMYPAVRKLVAAGARDLSLYMTQQVEPQVAGPRWIINNMQDIH